jgi:hypothetical protein
MDQVNVLPLVMATNVVGFAGFSVMENYVDSTGMVFNP